ncbi:ATP-dependent metallopeptidase FtsH/Yme1/Tma family protein, partial [Candidatus Dependentiae bacterium]
MKKKIRKKLPFKGGPKYFFIAIALIAFFLLLSRFVGLSRNIKKISYSKFLKLVEGDQVKKVHATGQEVSGELKDGTSFETVIAHSPKNWDLLKNHDVEVEVESNAGGLGSFWILFPFLSLILTILFIWYLMRQAKGGSSGGSSGSNIFSMGKSRHRLFRPTE